MGLGAFSIRAVRTSQMFTAVLEWQKQLDGSGVTIMTGVDETVERAASIALGTPDENPVLIDQHR